jgi:2-oxoglutarate/2-oxoacid ferredoxin oxidoreductase subunit beta
MAIDDLVPNDAAELPVVKLTAKDFASSADVRWCPGCGDYAILAMVQRTLPDLGRKKEEYCFVAGIGCSSRFPYYMDCYGFHGIHGRAPAIASGLKTMRPELSVWIATGDGDGLSIGGNHMMHLLRRNFDTVLMLFNNRIYGLTKGQYSPTSEEGKRTKSTPFGSVDHPLNPLLFAMGCEGTFVARTIDRDPKHQQEIYRRAYEHKGTSFVEIYQNCNIFNDGAFEHLTDKKIKDDNLVVIEHGQPLVYGKEDDKGIRLDGFTPQAVSLVDGSFTKDDLIVYDETNPELAYIVARLTDDPAFPTPIGVFLRIDRPTYEDVAARQIEGAIAKMGEGSLEAILNEGDIWEVA